MRKIPIRFKLNGVARQIDVEPNDTLLETLRDKLGIKSPKSGCDRGDCGTCTVFLDGRTVRSCLVLAPEADGCEIVTLEGLSQAPTPLQREFARHNSFQCGFCAPGIVLSATELLEKNPRPTRAEIQDAIAGNLCRCTGYMPIIEAIESVAAATSGETPEGAGVARRRRSEKATPKASRKSASSGVPSGSFLLNSCASPHGSVLTSQPGTRSRGSELARRRAQAALPIADSGRR